MHPVLAVATAPGSQWHRSLAHFLQLTALHIGTNVQTRQAPPSVPDPYPFVPAKLMRAARE